MPDRAEHLRQATRFEGFVTSINTPQQLYREWVVIVWFHIALHYVDAFLADKGHPQIAGHSDRWSKMGRYPETRVIVEPFERLYKEAKEARYNGGDYTPVDLSMVERLYQRVRAVMREALRL